MTGGEGMASVTASVTASLSSAMITPTAADGQHLTVSTITTTRWHSVTDCPTTVKDCPVSTSQVDIYTTTCPVSGPHATAPAGGDYTLVKTLYSTNWHTVSKCSETVSHCPLTMTSEVKPTGYVTVTYPAGATLTAVPVPGGPGMPGGGEGGGQQPGKGGPMPGGGEGGQQPGKGGPMPGAPSTGYPATNGTLPKPPPSHGTGAASPPQPPKPTMPAGGDGGSGGSPSGPAAPIETAGAGRLAGPGLALAAFVVAAAPLFL